MQFFVALCHIDISLMNQLIDLILFIHCSFCISLTMSLLTGKMWRAGNRCWNVGFGHANLVELSPGVDWLMKVQLHIQQNFAHIMPGK